MSLGELLVGGLLGLRQALAEDLRLLSGSSVWRRTYWVSGET